MGEPIAELGGKTWEELEVLEHDAGQLMFPAKLRRRNASGKVVETTVRIRVPSPMDHFEARAEARALMRKKDLDLVADKDMFEQIEQLCLLARAIRTFDPPHPQFDGPEELAALEQGCLNDIQEQINAVKAKLDPRPSLKTEEEVWRTIIGVAREADIGPLVDIAGHEQPILVVRMALEACRSPTAQPWLQSFGISIPALSASASSPPS